MEPAAFRISQPSTNGLPVPSLPCFRGAAVAVPFGHNFGCTGRPCTAIPSPSGPPLCDSQRLHGLAICCPVKRDGTAENNAPDIAPSLRWPPPVKSSETFDLHICTVVFPCQTQARSQVSGSMSTSIFKIFLGIISPSTPAPPPEPQVLSRVPCSRLSAGLPAGSGVCYSPKSNFPLSIPYPCCGHVV